MLNDVNLMNIVYDVKIKFRKIFKQLYTYFLTNCKFKNESNYYL